MNPFDIKPDILWTTRQVRLFNKLAKDPNVTLAYWCCDKNDLPSNGGNKKMGPAKAGLMQKISGKFKPCSKGAFHATKFPHLWDGEAVWVVALSGDIVFFGDKIAASQRQFVGRVYGSDQLSVLVKICNDFSGKCIPGQEISDLQLRNYNFYRTNFKQVSFCYTHFEQCVFEYCNFTNCQFNSLYLENCIFRDCTFSSSNLNENNIECCLFINCHFPKQFKKNKTLNSAFIK